MHACVSVCSHTCPCARVSVHLCVHTCVRVHTCTSSEQKDLCPRRPRREGTNLPRVRSARLTQRPSSGWAGRVAGEPQKGGRAAGQACDLPSATGKAGPRVPLPRHLLPGPVSSALASALPASWAPACGLSRPRPGGEGSRELDGATHGRRKSNWMRTARTTRCLGLSPGRGVRASC